MARSLWCLVRHLVPEHVTETGVAHGVSSRCILEALERNGSGHLWSIDLPPITIPERHREIAAAVPEERRGRWTYIEGSSRRRLPALLGELGRIELFWHDSWHSTRNTRWELERAWSALIPGGAVGADDIDHNSGASVSSSDRSLGSTRCTARPTTPSASSGSRANGLGCAEKRTRLTKRTLPLPSWPPGSR